MNDHHHLRPKAITYMGYQTNHSITHGHSMVIRITKGKRKLKANKTCMEIT